MLPAASMRPHTFAHPGIVYLDETDEILMLTWREGKVLLFDAATLEQKKVLDMVPTKKGEVSAVDTTLHPTSFHHYPRRFSQTRFMRASTPSWYIVKTTSLFFYFGAMPSLMCFLFML